MPVKVTKLGFLGLGMTKADEMKHHYTQVLGLPMTSDSGKDGTYFACGNEHHAVALFPTDKPGYRHVGLQIEGEGPLDDALAELRKMGIAASIKSDPFHGVSSAIEVADPDGYMIFLYRSIAQAKAIFSGQGIAPQKLGHVAMRAGDAKRSTDFFIDALGFRWSDWMADVFAFLRCNSDHHTLNFLTSQFRGMFHVAFEVRDYSAHGRACDILGMQRIPLIWGPGRHGIGHNVFVYYYDPDGNVVEIFTDMDKMSDERLGYFDPRPHHQDFPQRPKVWAREPIAANLWGIMPPPGFEA